jgi:hypothetical protein
MARGPVSPNKMRCCAFQVRRLCESDSLPPLDFLPWGSMWRLALTERPLKRESSMIERYWNADLIAKTFGTIFLVVGILGFFPNPIVSDHGVFLVNTSHNLVHIITGLIFFAGAYWGAPVMTVRWLGVVYAIVAILGIIWPDRPIASVDMNWADNWLHIVLAIALLFIGFATPVQQRFGHARL